MSVVFPSGLDRFTNPGLTSASAFNGLAPSIAPTSDPRALSYMSAILTTRAVDSSPHPVAKEQTKVRLIAYLMRLRIRRVLFQVANWELFAAVAFNRAVNKAAIVAIRVASTRNRAARGRYERRVARIH